MSRDELLDELRALEVRLRSSEVQAAYRDRPPSSAAASSRSAPSCRC